ncbi:aldo/keto reductase [Schaalia suimastitidis]|uniref:aldo/keto reductase n=1 Tax=Schaalia suimastitidis TaxID=121163 RepID=UPI00041B59A0|nr:aldo/keto reductase [Schaalia suimastitidis]
MLEQSDVVGPRLPLSPEATIAQVGFGTFQIPPESTQQAVEEALEIGYRHIDTAAAYYNEAGVGAALKASAVPREQVFVTSKLRNVDHGRASARQAVEASLKALGLDTIDLYLIHWPYPSKDLYVDTWQALIEAQEDGLVTHIGVSNFLPHHLERLATETGVMPTVNQIEVHPRYSQPELRRYAREHGILIEAYSPLGQGADLQHPTIVALAERLNLAPAQVILAWHVASGRVVIPKSVHPERMKANLASAGIHLNKADCALIDSLHVPSGRVGGDPNTFAFTQTREDMAARLAAKK